ncbi:MAG: energy-coupling factor transporter transmembrane protein EcfT [Anaerolineae bacterium]|nr:energy-coupling factor transporter transmembrane protein EcfT [Anaerolineae bacterium]
MHPLAWFLWIAAAALVPLATRNPLYLVIDFAVTCVVADAVRGQLPQGPLPAFVSPVRFGLFAVPAGALFNVLTSHVGEAVFLRLPDAIPLIGGPLTVESLVYGAINGLILATLFSAFAVLTLAVPVRDLIAYLPRAFYPIAVVSAIAATFVPSSLRQFQQVREAQAIRGYRMRGLRDWLPLFMPVLIGGLERALQLAEAMTARGFASDESGEQASKRNGGRTVVSQLVLTGGLLCVLAGGVMRLLPQGSAVSLPLLLAGSLATAWVVWRVGSQVRYTRYRRPVWAGIDSAVAVLSVLAVIPLLVLAHDYSPYPRLSPPAFDLRVGIAFLGLLVPGLRGTGPLGSGPLGSGGDRRCPSGHSPELGTIGHSGEQHDHV